MLAQQFLLLGHGRPSRSRGDQGADLLQVLVGLRAVEGNVGESLPAAGPRFGGLIRRHIDQHDIADRSTAGRHDQCQKEGLAGNFLCNGCTW